MKGGREKEMKARSLFEKEFNSDIQDAKEQC